jgi:RNA polymerase-binding transcription factor DksA
MEDGELRLALGRDQVEAARTVADLEAELTGILDQQATVAPDDEHDAEGSTIGFERARVTALVAHARQVLGDLDQAQARMAAGTYGRCVACGGPIPALRLAARPTATTCVGCASPSGSGVGRRRP